MSTACTQSLDLIEFSHEEKQGPLEKWLNLGLGNENVQDEPVSYHGRKQESAKKRKQTTMMGICQRDIHAD